MKLDVKKLLRKKQLTGKEVGQLCIAALCQDMKVSRTGKGKLLFTQAEMQALTDSIHTEAEWKVYKTYRTLYISIVDLVNQRNLHTQQFLHGYYRLWFNLDNYRIAESIKKSIETRPMIFTAKQYKKLKEETIQSLKEKKYCLARIISQYLEGLTHEKLSNHVKTIEPAIYAALEKTKTTAASNQELLDSYFRYNDIGHFILSTGETFSFKELENCNAEDSSLVERISQAFIEENNPKWVSTGDPTKVMQYDLMHIYAITAMNEYDKGLTKVKNDLPELFATLLAHIEKHLPQFQGIKESQFYEPIVTGEEVGSSEMLFSKAYITATDKAIIQKYTGQSRPRKYAKIAIIRNPDNEDEFSLSTFVENTFPAEQDRLGENDLLKLDTDKDKQEEILTAVDLCLGGLNKIYASNAIIQCIAEAYEVPDLLDVAILDTTAIEDKIKGYNGMLALWIMRELTGSLEETDKKEEIIKNFFGPLDINKARPLPKQIKAVTEEMRKIGYDQDHRKLHFLGMFLKDLERP